MLQAPLVALMSYGRGHTLPAYAYALNNPLRWIDPDGNVNWDFQSDSADKGRWQGAATNMKDMVDKFGRWQQCSDYFDKLAGKSGTLAEMLKENSGPKATVDKFKGAEAYMGGKYVGPNHCALNVADQDLADNLCMPMMLIHELAHVAKQMGGGRPTADVMGKKGEGWGAIAACFGELASQRADANCSFTKGKKR